MRHIILDRLKSKTEELQSEELAGFRTRHSSVEQISHSNVLIEKYLKHQKNLFTDVMDLKKYKEFDWLWHDGL